MHLFKESRKLVFKTYHTVWKVGIWEDTEKQVQQRMNSKGEIFQLSSSDIRKFVLQ